MRRRADRERMRRRVGLVDLVLTPPVELLAHHADYPENCHLQEWIQEQARRSRFYVPPGWQVYVALFGSARLATREPAQIRVFAAPRPAWTAAARRDTSEWVARLLASSTPERTPT